MVFWSTVVLQAAYDYRSLRRTQGTGMFYSTSARVQRVHATECTSNEAALPVPDGSPRGVHLLMRRLENRPSAPPTHWNFTTPPPDYTPRLGYGLRTMGRLLPNRPLEQASSATRDPKERMVRVLSISRAIRQRICHTSCFTKLAISRQRIKAGGEAATNSRVRRALSIQNAAYRPPLLIPGVLHGLLHSPRLRCSRGCDARCPNHRHRCLSRRHTRQ